MSLLLPSVMLKSDSPRILNFLDFGLADSQSASLLKLSGLLLPSHYSA